LDEMFLTLKMLG